MVARFGILRIGLLEMLVYRWKHAVKNRHQRMDNSYRCPGHSNLPERYPGTSRPKTALRLYQFPKNLGGKRTLSDKAILSFFEMVRSQGPAFLGRRTSRRTKRLSSNFAGTVGAGSTLTTSGAPTDTTWGMDLSVAASRQLGPTPASSFTGTVVVRSKPFHRQSSGTQQSTPVLQAAVWLPGRMGRRPNMVTVMRRLWGLASCLALSWDRAALLNIVQK